MLTKPELLDILNQLPGQRVGSISDHLGQDDAAVNMADDLFALTKARRMLEIGTHTGKSGAIWLARSEATLVSCDIGGEWVDTDTLSVVVTVLTRAFPGRFTFIRGDSTSDEVKAQIAALHGVQAFDLAFVDGNHTYEYCRKDIETALALGIPYILVDDYTSCVPIQDACRDTGLVPVKVYEAIHNTANIGIALFTRPA